MKIGVYVCHCGINIAATVDVERVVEFASKLPNVAVARHYMYMCSDPGQDLIKKDIEELGLDRVVVAACSPRMHEPTFRGVLEEKGLNPYFFEMANIREHCSWVHEDKEEATKKAMDLVKSAVARAALLEPLEEKEADVTPAALVIGGGVAGMYAALDIADAGFKVYLVEKSPTIGGKMAMLDKTFPTLDCSACILTPRMVDVARHPNIELLTYSEIVSVEGAVGNFKVKVKKKPRYVDEAKCTGCGACAEACRVRKVPNEYDAGISYRSAIYRPFPYAVPATFTIDPERCLMLTRGKCGKAPACVEACGPGAIDFEQREKEVELEVGAIIVATGFDLFDAKLKPEYGYGKYPNVITGLEFERLSSASGPTLGEIKINGRTPKRIVFLQCVGSRDKQVGNEYCSRVCCMYTAKHAHLIKEKIPDAEITICYMDVRAFGKGYEEFYERVQREGVIYRRGNAAEVYKKSPDEDTLIVRLEDTLLGEPMEIEADLVVLATAIVPSEDADEIAKMLKLSRSPDRFFLEAHMKLRPVDTAVDGVFLAGCCQGPKDIPDTVAQAKAAASAALSLLATGKVKTEAITSTINEELCSGCRTCEAVCAYGALKFDEERGIMTVNDVLCKGCGACGATCPSGAISMKHFKDEQIFAQIEALTS